MMTQRLKRWESPRRQGRNDKGKGGSARQRQLKKQTQMLRKKLQENQESDKRKDNQKRIDTLRRERTEILGSPRSLNLDSLRRLSQR
ncbi:MAG TPA: hypothetical protein DCY91_12360 [Cyanobacteria bacterium UBA11370]|nr:hypothetical protein [Cyanobacteria bacterium UBA11370]